MDKFAFAPVIDLPLVAVTLATFIWHFNHWAFRKDLDTNIDVAARLPTARYRVTVLLMGFLLLCWLANFAAWGIYALLFAIGVAMAIFSSGNFDGGAFGLCAAAYLIREWSFGFPQLVLHPQKRDSSVASSFPENELVGKTGITTSPLRPIGNAIIDGVEMSVVSYDGCLLDTGTQVVVLSFRNGRANVRPLLSRKE